MKESRVNREISCGYLYGFNGYEKDDEVKGEGNHIDFGNRSYDNRLARFMSIDRFASQFPEQSPYLFAGNSPIQYIDINGDFKISPEDRKKYPKFNTVLKGMKNYMNNHPEWKENYFAQLGMKIGDKKDEKTFNKMFTYGKGPKLTIKDFEKNNAALTNSKGKISINKDLVQELESADNKLNLNGRNGYSLSGMQFLAFVTVAHEGLHHLDIKKNGDYTDEYDNDYGNIWEKASFGGIPQFKYPKLSDISDGQQLLLRYMKTPDDILKQISIPSFKETPMGDDDFLDSPIENNKSNDETGNQSERAKF